MVGMRLRARCCERAVLDAMPIEQRIEAFRNMRKQKKFEQTHFFNLLQTTS
jgi:hypothetical protein